VFTSLVCLKGGSKTVIRYYCRFSERFGERLEPAAAARPRGAGQRLDEAHDRVAEQGGEFRRTERRPRPAAQEGPLGSLFQQ